MPANSSPIRRAFLALVGPAALAILAVWMLHASLFSGGRFVPAWPKTDLFEVYIPWRYFGFNEWKNGHFPFWNPHVFCGIPFFAQIQSTLLYPIAWVNFFLNTATAATLEMTISLAAGGICTYAWGRQRGLSRSAATLAGALYAFSGPFYEHVTVGYLTVLATLAWAPLVFLAVDRLIRERYRSGILIGALAVCLQCLAGHAQILYYTLLVAGIYVLLQSVGRKRVLRLYGAFAVTCLLGAMLAAVQLVPSYFATQLSIRAGGTSYAFASSFSFPVENLLTLLIPYPLGDMVNAPYFGKWYLWETTLYLGILGLALAGLGIATLRRGERVRIILLLAMILVLALGTNTPAFPVLYHYLPGFDLFRGPSKFCGLATLWIAMLAGHGWQRVQRGQIPRYAIPVFAIGCAGCALAAIMVHHSDPAGGIISQLVHYEYVANEYYSSSKYFLDYHYVGTLIHLLVWQCGVAATLLGLACLMLYLRRFFVAPAYVLLGLALLEICASGAESTPLTPLQFAFASQWTEPLAIARNADERLLFANMAYANFGEMRNYDSIWGYDTGQPKRYTQLFMASQNEPAMAPDQYYYSFRRVSRIFALLRCRYVLQWDITQPFLTIPDPLPHLSLIGNDVRMNDPAAMVEKLRTDFDFRHSVILETTPSPLPTPAGTAGRAILLRQSINDLEIQADLPAPALLLITDAYAPGWHVRPLENNFHQAKYDVLCADDVLRAIPLAAGHHHFDLFYTPPGLWVGIAISGAGAVIFATLAAMAIGRREKSLAAEAARPQGD